MTQSQGTLEEGYQQLFDLLQAGVSLPDAVSRLSGRVDGLSGEAVAEASNRLANGQIENGFDRLGFPERDARILTAGHNAGDLRSVIEELSNVYREWNEVKTTALTSLIMIFVAGLLLLVVPVIFIFMAVGYSVAGSSGSVMAGVIQGLFYGAVCFLPVAVLWAAFIWLLARTFNGMFLGESPPSSLKWLFSLPIVKSVYRHLTFALVYLQWRLMYRVGVAPDQIFRSINRACPRSDTVLPYAAEQMARGSSINELQLLGEFFPANDYNQLRTGEEAGTLGEVLGRLERRHFESMLEILENLPSYLLWILLVVYGGYLLLAFGALLFLMGQGFGPFTTSGLPEGTLPSS